MSSTGSTQPPPPNLLDDTSRDFLCAEYRALRDEILALEDRGMKIQIAGLSGIPSLIAAGDLLKLPFLIIFGPVIILVASLMTIFTQDSIMRDGAYIKDHIEPRLLQDRSWGWEHFLQEPGHRRVEQYTRLSVVLAFAFYYIGAAILACIRFSQALVYLHLSQRWYSIAVDVAAMIYGSAFVWASIFIHSYFPKGTDSASQTKTKSIWSLFKWLRSGH